MINCSLGDDGVASSGDTCSLACDTGYELTGSDIRTCQSDGSWSGNVTMCSRGEYFIASYLILLNIATILMVRYCLKATPQTHATFLRFTSVYQVY